MELSAVRGSLSPEALQRWDSFVEAHPQAKLCHTSRWVSFAANVFGFEPAWLTAGSPLTGILPLIRQTSRLFGSRWVSLPFFNYGGRLGVDEATETGLLLASVDLAEANGVSRLEIRDRMLRDGYVTRSDKVAVVLALPDSIETLAESLGSKLRSQIRRADREHPQTIIGGRELVSEFYALFAETMRDLGTPAYPRRFFETMFDQVGVDCTIVIVRLNGDPAAAAVLTRFRDVTEIPWAANRQKYRPAAANMRLYWECLCHAIRNGSRQFDFGRSTRDSGTHRFKLQWGGQTIPMYWLYPLLPADSIVNAAPGRAMAAARRIWRHLPVPIATHLGASFSAGLPW
jgi:FemAB-related protein (PEP-CTERM system-associated)